MCWKKDNTTYIWLVHTFFTYYYFQSFTYAPQYSTLIFIWCMILSTVTGIALDWVDRGVWRLFQKPKQS